VSHDRSKFDITGTEKKQMKDVPQFASMADFNTFASLFNSVWLLFFCISVYKQKIGSIV